MSKKSYTEAELIEGFNLPYSSILDFFDKYECKRVVIGYPSISHVIYGYNNPDYLPDIAHLIDYGVGKTVIISSYETGSPRYQVYNFPDRRQAINFVDEVEYTLFVPIDCILNFITQKIGFWSYKTTVNILDDNEYNIILVVEGRRIELTDDNFMDRVLITQKTLLIENDLITNAKSAVEYYRNIFKMSRRFVAEITGIPLKTLNAFSSSPDRSILKTNALNVYKLAQLFGVSMEQLLLTECEINPTSKAFLESKEV